MGQPVVVNGQSIALTKPAHPTIGAAFDTGSPKLTYGGRQVVLSDGTLGGVPFVATLMSQKTLVGGKAIVLVGAVVTRGDGYTGVIPSACGAGPTHQVG